jgi:hypothetical protein
VTTDAFTDVSRGLIYKPTNYLGLFTVESWREFKRHGEAVMGFTAKKASAAAKLQTGDHILCYLTKVSAFVGVLRVTGRSFTDETPIWTDGVFPVRVPVVVEREVSLMNAVPIRSLSQRLSFMRGAANNTGWTIHVRSSPRRWRDDDAAAVLDALAKSSRLNPSGHGRDESSSDAGTPPRRAKLPRHVRVGRIIEKTERLKEAEPPELLSSYESVLSYNKVTGYSVNVPIAETCRPTAMCMKTCYFASGAPSWSNALRHQRKVYETMKADPKGFAERAALEYDRLDLSFLRWNGGGDLFRENVQAINYLGQARPDIILWVVTRIPSWAAQIDHAPNVFIHFSLDRHSLGRRAEFIALNPKSRNYFFSYQCDKGEVPPLKNLQHVAVMFFDNYQPTTDLKQFPKEIVCPLNTVEDISDVCVTCRRCFDGSAVNFGRLQSA